MMNRTLWNEIKDIMNELPVCEMDSVPHPENKETISRGNDMAEQKVSENGSHDGSLRDKGKILAYANSTVLLSICFPNDKKKWLLDLTGMCMSTLIMLSNYRKTMNERSESNISTTIGVYPYAPDNSIESPVDLVEVDTQDNVFEGVVPIGPVKPDKQLLKMRIDYASAKAGKWNESGVIPRFTANCKIEGHVRGRCSLCFQQVQIRSQ